MFHSADIVIAFYVCRSLILPISPHTISTICLLLFAVLLLVFCSQVGISRPLYTLSHKMLWKRSRPDVPGRLLFVILKPCPSRGLNIFPMSLQMALCRRCYIQSCLHLIVKDSITHYRNGKLIFKCHSFISEKADFTFNVRDVSGLSPYSHNNNFYNPTRGKAFFRKPPGQSTGVITRKMEPELKSASTVTRYNALWDGTGCMCGGTF